MFHVSLLKRCLGKSNIHDPALPPTDLEGNFIAQPVAVLARRMAKRNNPVEVQWSNSLPEDTTWEDCSVLERKFPAFILEAKD